MLHFVHKDVLPLRSHIQTFEVIQRIIGSHKRQVVVRHLPRLVQDYSHLVLQAIVLVFVACGRQREAVLSFEKVCFGRVLVLVDDLHQLVEAAPQRPDV